MSDALNEHRARVLATAERVADIWETRMMSPTMDALDQLAADVAALEEAERTFAHALDVVAADARKKSFTPTGDTANADLRGRNGGSAK